MLQNYSSVSETVAVTSLQHLAEVLRFCRLKYNLEIILADMFITS